MAFILLYIILPITVMLLFQTQVIQIVSTTIPTRTTTTKTTTTATTAFIATKVTAATEGILQQSRNVSPLTLNYLGVSSRKADYTITGKYSMESSNQNVPFQFTNNNKNDNSNSNSNGSVHTIDLISVALLKQQQQSQTLINQQSVIQLIRNMDKNLRQMRTLEMQVTTIQEIFDSLHFTAASSSSSSIFSSTNPIHNIHLVLNKNVTLLMNVDGNSSKLPTWEHHIQNDLEMFAKRITKKLEKAINIVQDLYGFFQNNITQTIQLTNDYMEEVEEIKKIVNAENINLLKTDQLESQFDINFNDALFEASTKLKSINLKTQIDMCYNTKNSNEQNNRSEELLTKNYNKQQIQILNYDSNAKQQQHRNNYIDIYVKSNLDLNAYIKEKIHTIKMKLIKNDKLNIEERQQQQHHQQKRQQQHFPVNSNLKYFDNHLKRIYFLSGSDRNMDYDFHLRHVYTSSIQQKYVFLVIDIGSSMTVELMELAKTFISVILQLLCSNDLISLVKISNEVETMLLLETSAQDAANGLYWATRECKDKILAYIHTLTPTTGHTNHTLSFDYTFHMLERLENMNLISTKQPLEFVYITTTLISNLQDTRRILSIISKGQKSLQQPIIINTCAVLPDKHHIEKQFLRDIVQQNYAKYDLNVTDWIKTNQQQLNGKAFILSKSRLMKFPNIAMDVFEKDFHEPYFKQNWQLHKPIFDESSEEPLVPLSLVVPPFGVVGVDLYFNDLVEDVVSYQFSNQQSGRYNNHYQENQQEDFVYAFLVEMDGNTLIHPAFPKAFSLKQFPFPVDIGYLENSTNFANIRQRLLTEANGNATTLFYLKKHQKHITMERSYHWKSIYNMYVLCMVINRQLHRKKINLNSALNYKPIFQTPITLSLRIQQQQQHFALNNENVPIYPDHNDPLNYDYITDSHLIYHRLDLLLLRGNVNLCRYFHQLATNDAATLFLSSTTFQSPFTYQYINRLSSTQAQLHSMESIMAYLKDPTGLLANPGLKPHIRKEVNVLYRAVQHLKKRHQYGRSTMHQYIIRRYIASVNGVLQVYPGCMLKSDYDPTQRPWFHKAIQHPGKVISTKPYLDAGSSGYVITIAHTIFGGKPDALHANNHDQPVAIVAVDITYTYFYKMILEGTPLCQTTNIKCLMFENEGYLIAHPTMLEPSTHTRNYRRPYEHLAHKESYLASDILNHKKLVRKLACANYRNRMLQRYYIFNTSQTEIITNVVHGERTKYAIALIRGSNIFAAVLNSTCDGGAFCPCSTIDSQCLNCKRMDPIDCECPCECPMPYATMSNDDDELDFNDVNNIKNWPNNKLLNITHQYSYCEPSNDEFVPLIELKQNRNFINQYQSALLPPCLNINCDVFGTQKDCLAVMGCEWCQQDIEGDGFITPFCSAQSLCFNGVMTSFSPYDDIDNEDLMAARGFQPLPPKANTYSAIGPVGGAIVILAIVIGFATYCYRHNIGSTSQEQFYMDSIQEENCGLPLSRFKFDDCQTSDESPGGCGGGVNGDINDRDGTSGSYGYNHNNIHRTLITAIDVSPYHMSTDSSYRRPPNGESDQGYSTMTPHEDSSDHQCFTLAEPLLSSDKRNCKSDTISVSTSISSPTNRRHKDIAKATITSSMSNKKYHPPHTQKYKYQLPLHNYDNDDITPASGATHLILAPVTVHRRMET